LGFYFLEKNKNKKTNEKRKTQANEWNQTIILSLSESVCLLEQPKYKKKKNQNNDKIDRTLKNYIKLILISDPNYQNLTHSKSNQSNYFQSLSNDQSYIFIN
jgi:hypothetical protein